MAFRFRFDYDAAAFDFDDADDDIAADESPIGHGVDPFFADADRAGRTQNSNGLAPFIEIFAVVGLGRISLFFRRTVLEGQFFKEPALGQVLANNIKQYNGQDRPAGQDVDGFIRRPEHEEQAAEQEDDAGQATKMVRT